MKLFFGSDTIVELQGRDISLENEPTDWSMLKVAFRTSDELKRMRKDRNQVQKDMKVGDAPIPALRSKLPRGFRVSYNVDTEHMRLDIDIGEFNANGKRIN